LGPLVGILALIIGLNGAPKCININLVAENINKFGIKYDM